jgi:acyl carrier protein
MRAIPVSQLLDVFDELMGSNAVQVSVINLEWKDFLRSMHGRIPARFADLADRSEAEADTSTALSRVREILEADARTLPPLLKTYLRDHFARAMGAPAARIDTEQSVLSLGLDSLIAVEVRNRINTDLGMNIPLAVFMQSASISALATYMMERMLGSDHGERSKTENVPIAPEVVVDISPRAEHSGFAHTNKLIKEEADAHSSVVAQARH